MANSISKTIPDSSVASKLYIRKQEEASNYGNSYSER
jgi:hypothetical protein